MMTKEKLLGWLLARDTHECMQMLEVARGRMDDIGANKSPFSPFHYLVVRIDPTGKDLSANAIVEWIESITQPDGIELQRRNKTMRNDKVFQIEILGEFAVTLQARLDNRLKPYRE